MGPSIPGYPSLTVGYPTELQKGGIDIMIPVLPAGTGVKMLEMPTRCYKLLA